MAFELTQIEDRIAAEEALIESVKENMEDPRGLYLENVRELYWTRIDAALSISALRRTMSEQQAA